VSRDTTVVTRPEDLGVHVKPVRPEGALFSILARKVDRTQESQNTNLTAIRAGWGGLMNLKRKLGALSVLPGNLGGGGPGPNDCKTLTAHFAVNGNESSGRHRGEHNVMRGHRIRHPTRNLKTDPRL